MTLIGTGALGAASATTGIAFGLAYFGAVRRTAALLAAHGSWPLAAGLTLCRILAAALLFALAARQGAVALLAAFAGFLLARMIALRSATRSG
ncbi:MAG TPA: ATP synthase subunit I [Stellaceae bacterium]|nr:ATP synthase subunit I [Stellaceae bacterium]